MRNNFFERHSFDKEIYMRFNHAPKIKSKERDPITYEDRSAYYAKNEDNFRFNRKNRELAKGNFYDKFQGTFKLNYDTFEEYRPSKKHFAKDLDDPIKTYEVIPPANFIRPRRNPITEGDCFKEPELKIKPDMISSVFDQDGDYNEKYYS